MAPGRGGTRTDRSSPKEPTKTAKRFPRNTGTAKAKRFVHMMKRSKRQTSNTPAPSITGQQTGCGARVKGAGLLHAKAEEGGVVGRRKFQADAAVDHR